MSNQLTESDGTLTSGSGDAAGGKVNDQRLMCLQTYEWSAVPTIKGLMLSGTIITLRDLCHKICRKDHAIIFGAAWNCCIRKMTSETSVFHHFHRFLHHNNLHLVFVNYLIGNRLNIPFNVNILS